MSPLALCLLAAYVLVAGLIYWRFCHKHQGIGWEERFWGCAFWPLLLVAAAVFCLLIAAHSKELDNESARALRNSKAPQS